jgi:hypothetical protein
MADDWTKHIGAELYFDLGRALTQWQHVEIGVYHVFLCLTQMPNQLIASAVFFSPINFKDKLSMVDSAARFALTDTTRLDDWEKLSGKVRKKSRKRNELAHFMSIHNGAPSDLKSYLRPNIWDAKSAMYYLKAGHLPEYSPKQLRERAQSFGRLAFALEEFAKSLRGLELPSPEIHPLQEAHPAPAKENKERRSPKARGTPRGSSRA